MISFPASWLPGLPLRVGAAAALVAVVLAFAGGGRAYSGAQEGRLDSHLRGIVEELRVRGADAALDRAEEHGIRADGGVRVVVEASDGLAAAAARGAERLGGTVEVTHGDLVQVRVPPASMQALAARPGVELVRVPMRAIPLDTGQGVALTNADDWHSQGITGAGIKVGVLDLGFYGYEALLGSELPPSVTAMSFRADGDIHAGTQAHGTGVAEVVYEMAPGAEMYLANFNTEVELGAATAWLEAQGVEIVNASWGYFVSGPGNGTGIVNDIVSDSVSAGTFWSVAAGNHTTKHWSGTFQDTDANGFHEFALSPLFDEGNQLQGLFGQVLEGEIVAAELKWDDPYGASCRDYDLYLMRTDEVGQPVIVASSTNTQHDGVGCVPGANPTEELVHTVPVTDFYHLVIKEEFSTSDAFMHLYSGFHDVEYFVASNSILQPADNPDVTTVGAVYHGTPNNIEPFSSMGPTTDSRIKPDIVAPDGVVNSTFGAFFGTSAAAPHIAGAAALIKSVEPCYGPQELGSTLEALVVDLGAAGKDNTYGSGRLSLGAVPADFDSDGVADDCDTDDDNDGISDDSDPDDDNDLVYDVAEAACGGVTPSILRPERVDGAFEAVDDDGDTLVDEALPPGSDGFDCDGDGFVGSTEEHVYEGLTDRDQDPCGEGGWPADVVSSGGSENKLTLNDLTSFIFPSPSKLNTSPGDAGWDQRYDIVPDGSISLQDITALLFGPTASPPMFEGERAFNGPECPWPP